MDYKKYSLEKLEEWVHDTMSGDATPQEIYSTIREVVRENYYYHKEHCGRASELLQFLNGHRPVADEELHKAEKEYYERNVRCDVKYDSIEQIIAASKKSLTCDKDDPSPESQGAWNDFWEQSYLSGVTDTPEEAEELREELKKVREEGGYDWMPRQDKVVKWQLPVEADASGEYFVQFPDDLLDAANLKEGDTVEWVDNGKGSYLLRKV